MLDQFKRPWHIKIYNNACYIVEDADRRKLATFYYRDDQVIYGGLSKSEALQCAQAFARLSKEE